MDEATLVVLSTFPHGTEAGRVAEILIGERLAACANVLPGVHSIYQWKGQVEKSSEVLVIFKTTTGAYPAFEARLKALHSYEVPEILALPVHAGFEEYLRWVNGSVIAPEKK